jgi:nucleoside phosphorylase
MISRRGRTAPRIGIVTALSFEYAAVEALLENPEIYMVSGTGAGRRYLLGEIPTNREKHSVVLALAGIGNNVAATRATLVLEHFPSVKDIIMVGIAGGVPNPRSPAEDVRLGDVVVSDARGIIQYDFEKEGITEVIPRHPPRPPSSSLLEAVNLLKAAEIRGDRPWKKYLDQAMLKLKITRPPERTDILVSTRDPSERIAHPRDPDRVRGEPKVILGPIASSNTLLANPIKRDELRDRFKVKAIEMEGSGIADATSYLAAGYLVIRGISDYCDQTKGDKWQLYAAVAAASYARAFIASIPYDLSETSTTLGVRAKTIEEESKELRMTPELRFYIGLDCEKMLESQEFEHVKKEIYDAYLQLLDTVFSDTFRRDPTTANKCGIDIYRLLAKLDFFARLEGKRITKCIGEIRSLIKQTLIPSYENRVAYLEAETALEMAIKERQAGEASKKLEELKRGKKKMQKWLEDMKQQ